MAEKKKSSKEENLAEEQMESPAEEKVSDDIQKAPEVVKRGQQQG